MSNPLRFCGTLGLFLSITTSSVTRTTNTSCWSRETFFHLSLLLLPHAGTNGGVPTVLNSTASLGLCAHLFSTTSGKSKALAVKAKILVYIHIYALLLGRSFIQSDLQFYSFVLFFSKMSQTF